jgi:hypothetical protein
MCRIQSKSRAKQFSGYKVVVKKNGKYYSPSTGLKYEVGMKLPSMTKRHTNAHTKWKDPLAKDGRWYNELMQGKTGVFRTIASARWVTKHYPELTIIKMTVGGEMYKGSLGSHLLSVGTEILEMNEI